MIPRDTETLGQKIRRHRIEIGMTQKELAGEFVTVSMISQIENDRNHPSIELLKHISRKLQVPLNELLKDEVNQMALASQHELAKVYLESNQAKLADPLLQKLLSHSDMPQAQTIDLTLDFARCKYLQSNYDSTLDLLLPLIKQLEESNYDDAYTLAATHHLIGNTFYMCQKFPNAIYHYQRGFDLTNRFVTFDILAAKISYNLGISLRITGRVNESTKYLDIAYNFFKDNGDIARLATTIYEQGISFKNSQDYTRAIECFSEAKGIYHALNLRENYFIVQEVMASTILFKQAPQLAIKQLQECIRAFHESKNYPHLILSNSRMASILLSHQNFADAHQFLIQTQSLIDELSLPEFTETGEFYQTFAQYHRHCENFVESIEYALKAANLYDRIGLITDQVDSLQIVAEVYHEVGDYSNAYQYQQQCSLILRSLYDKGERIL